MNHHEDKNTSKVKQKLGAEQIPLQPHTNVSGSPRHSLKNSATIGRKSIIIGQSIHSTYTDVVNNNRFVEISTYFGSNS